MREDAFTLIELLVTMAIVGILTAIAVPQYNQYKQRAFDVRAASDLRNVANAEEAYFLDNEEYLSCDNDSCADLPGISSLSPGVTLQVTAADINFTASSTHPLGTGKIFEWDSDQGGMID